MILQSFEFCKNAAYFVIASSVVFRAKYRKNENTQNDKSSILNDRSFANG